MPKDEVSLDKISFFGTVDRQRSAPNGKILSEYPAWYNEQLIDDLREKISSKERAIAENRVDPRELPTEKENLDQLKKRMSEIERSRPKNMDGKTKDHLAKFYKEMGKEISDLMFDRTSMMKGTADAHIEASRMEKPCINLPDEFAELASKLNVVPTNGKINRNQASRMWKIIGRALEEETNCEILRKDHKHGTYRSDIPLEELMRAKDI